MASSDFDATTNIVYSWDDGVSWETHRFHEKPVRVSQLTIEPTSTSLKFLLVGAVVDPATSVAGETVVIQLDFSELFGRKCVLDPTSATISDFEQWSPTTLNDKECVLGHRTTYWRRKASRKCYIGEDYKPPPSKTTNCECDDDDFECDSFAVRDVTTGKCMLVQRHPDEPDGCKEGTPFTGRSLYRRLPMTTCAGGMDMTTRSDYKCTGKSPTWTPPSTSPVYGDERIFVFDNGLNLNNFDSNVLYFEGHEDVITARDNRGSIWRSTDSGLSWSRFDMSQSVTEMVQNPYSHAHAYFLTSGRGHYYTRDGAHKFDPFPTPLEPTTFGQSLFFHAEEPSWLIFVGQKGESGEIGGFA